MEHETKRLILRPLAAEDEADFLSGVADRELRRLYGFPEELAEDTARRIFTRFTSLSVAWGLVRKVDGCLVGFLLDVPPELPEDMLRALPESGRTLAFAAFRPYQRQGYMREALCALIDRHLQTGDAGFLHAGHFPCNEASCRLLRSLGFREYGRHRLGETVIVDEVWLP